MKLIIAGSRTFTWLSVYFLEELMKDMKLFPDEIVSGGALGIDKLGECYAHRFNDDYSPCKLTIMKADWEQYGKAAGPLRNKEMAEYSDALLIVWDGESKGSKNMKETMQKLNKPIYEVIIK